MGKETFFNKGYYTNCINSRLSTSAHQVTIKEIKENISHRLREIFTIYIYVDRYKYRIKYFHTTYIKNKKSLKKFQANLGKN